MTRFLATAAVAFVSLGLALLVIAPRVAQGLELPLLVLAVVGSCAFGARLWRVRPTRPMLVATAIAVSATVAVGYATATAISYGLTGPLSWLSLALTKSNYTAYAYGLFWTWGAVAIWALELAVVCATVFGRASRGAVEQAHQPDARQLD